MEKIEHNKIIHVSVVPSWSMYVLNDGYCYDLTCKPQFSSLVEWVVMNTLHVYCKDKWNQAPSLVPGTKLLFMIITNIFEASPLQSPLYSGSLGTWSCHISLLFSDMFAKLEEEENPVPYPQPWVMGKNTRRLDQLSRTNLILLDIGTSCISHQWEISESPITKQYVLTPPRGRAGKGVVSTLAVLQNQLKQGHFVPFAHSQGKRDILVWHSSISD